MALHVPGEDANLVEVEGQAILGLGENGQVLRDFLVSILNLIQHEEGDDALAFRVLRDVERDVEIHHAGQHPADTVVGVAHQPPILDDGHGRFLFLRSTARRGDARGRARWRRNRSWLFGRASLQQR